MVVLSGREKRRKRIARNDPDETMHIYVIFFYHPTGQSAKIKARSQTFDESASFHLCYVSLVTHFHARFYLELFVLSRKCRENARHLRCCEK